MTNQSYLTCPHRGRKLMTVGGDKPATVHHCALHQYCSLDIGADHGKTHACSACPDVGAKIVPRVDVVVTSHDYGRYLDEALESVATQGGRILGTVVVVDDASGPDDQTRQICERRGVKYLRTEFRNPHLARGAGFALCESPLVHFLDADNTLDPSYLTAAAELFASNPRLAIAYADLKDFGTVNGLRVLSGDAESIERENFVDTGAVWSAEAIKQVGAFRFAPAGVEDWSMARQILRSGRWELAKNSIPLHYRRHAAQRINTIKNHSHYVRAGLADEVVTIFTTFSDRLQKSPELWERRKEWLRNQTWPRIRLVVANTSHKPMPSGWMDGLPMMLGLSVYDHPVGNPGLEDVDRRKSTIERDVQTALASIWNRMWQETQTEFVLTLEDDVFPHSLDAIRELMLAVTPNTCAVTGAYRQRYHPFGLTVWRHFPLNGVPMLAAEPGSGIEPVAGSGFGCLLLRRSQCAHEVVTGNTSKSRYYDADWFARLQAQRRQMFINWNVTCDHAGQTFDKAPEWKLGDQVETALSAVGITKDRITKWIGAPCGCAARQEKLNRLGTWALQLVTGKRAQAEARNELDQMLA